MVEVVGQITEVVDRIAHLLNASCIGCGIITDLRNFTHNLINLFTRFYIVFNRMFT